MASHQPTGWSTVSPQRRQEIALAATGVVLAGAAAATGLAVRGLVRRRSRSR